MNHDNSFITEKGILKKYVGTEKDVIIPQGIKKISSYAFSNCQSLTSITLSAWLTEINIFAFLGCENLKEIFIPKNVTKIEKGAFASCVNLQKITIDPHHPVYYVKNECLMEISSKKLIFGCRNSIIPEETTSIGDYAFAGCKGLLQAEIPNGTISIGEYAFFRCSGLEKISIPETVIQIGKSAFERCLKLTEIQLPSGIKKIEESMFALCAKLSSIRIPDGVEKIEKAAFAFCTKLKHITIPESVSEIGALTFVHCSSLPYIILPKQIAHIEEIGDNLPIIGESLFLPILKEDMQLLSLLGYAIAVSRNLASYSEDDKKFYIYFMQNKKDSLLDFNKANEEILSILQNEQTVTLEEIHSILQRIMRERSNL